jgi:integrase
MSEKIRISDKTVEALAPDARDRVVWDECLTGFGVRIRPTGAMRYIIQYRAGSGRNAPLRRMKIGSVGTITARDARAIAKKALGSIANGADPAAQRTAERETISFSELVPIFLKEHVEAKRKPSTAAYYRDILVRVAVPELGNRKADKVSHNDLLKLHLKLKDRPFLANRILAVVASMYSFAARSGLVPEGFNPTRRIERYREEGRERFLTSDELERLGAAIREAETVGIPWEVDDSKQTSKHVPKSDRLTKLGPHPAAALRLLLFTGCRLREVLHLKWTEIDFERGLLFLPSSKTGKKSVVLNGPAISVLEGLPRVGQYVIAGNDPDRPRSDLKRPWLIVKKRAGLVGVRIHDLRHSFASFGAGSGLGLPIIGKLLGHATQRMTARYAHLGNDPLRRASESIARQISKAMGEAGQRA